MGRSDWYFFSWDGLHPGYWMRILVQKSVIVLLLSLIAGSAAASNISDTDKYAWSHSAGWINFKPTHGGVTVYPDHLEGDAWAEDLGWIRLGSHSGGGGHTYANTTQDNWGVNNDGSGNLSGYAWSHTAGWINFNPTGGGVNIDGATGDFSGYAWSENTGWMHFKGTAQDSTPHKVRLLPGSTVAPFAFTDQTSVPLNAQRISDSITLSIAGSGTAAVTITGGEYELNGTGTWTASAGMANHGDSVRVRHTSANNYNTGSDTMLTVGSENDTFTSTTVASGTSFPGETATGSGGATATLSGAGCVFTSAHFLPLSAVAEAPPKWFAFPHGLFDFVASGCTPGGTVTITITYAAALDPTTVYWKYGPTADGPDGQPGTGDDGQPHWYQIPSVVAGNSISFDITDGGLGDDDLAADGTIIDQGGPAQPLQSIKAIPTLSGWGQILLALLLMAWGVRTVRRPSRATGRGFAPR